MTIQDIISSNSDTTSEFKNRIIKKNIEREIDVRLEEFKRSFFGSIEGTAKNISSGSIAFSWREEKEGAVIPEELKAELIKSLKEISYKRLEEFQKYTKDIFDIKEEKSASVEADEETGDSDSGSEPEASVNTEKNYFNY